MTGFTLHPLSVPAQPERHTGRHGDSAERGSDRGTARPRLLDLFCGAGGGAMGYHRAGFDVLGVDTAPQPRYPFPFVRADALDYLGQHGRAFDAVHASPPCQGHCALRWMHNAREHKDLIPAVREALRGNGRPYVIENVPGAALTRPLLLCGSMFGLGCAGAELRRHRLFETGFPVMSPVRQPECRHGRQPRVIGVYGGHGRDRRRGEGARDFPQAASRRAMGIGWMTGGELSQAIPPTYTEFLGGQLLLHIGGTADAGSPLTRRLRYQRVPGPEGLR